VSDFGDGVLASVALVVLSSGVNEVCIGAGTFRTTTLLPLPPSASSGVVGLMAEVMHSVGWSQACC